MTPLVPGLGNWPALALVGLSFITSLITATFSLGGGSLLIAAMTLVMRDRSLQFIGGLVVSAVRMIVGAAGPLVAAFVRGIPDRRQLVATHATLNALQHLFKIVVFVAMGFAFRQYLLLILPMVLAGFAGTTVGSRMLTRVPENVFRLAFRILLSLVALGLIRGAIAAPMPANAAGAAQDSAALVADIATRQDPRVSAALSRIEGLDRRLLALRSYLRAGPGLAQRWSWTAEQIAAFGQSPENRAIQTQIERVRQTFADANPGFDLWVNPQVRSLDTQLTNWNSNASVGRAAAGMLVAFREWLSSRPEAMPANDVSLAAEKFLSGYVPRPIPTLAAPGLSPHGQMRAIDFQVRKDGRTVAGPVSATMASAWDAAGWTEKLKAAVHAGSDRFTGPLPSPREPWHYTYTPAPEP